MLLIQVDCNRLFSAFYTPYTPFFKSYIKINNYILNNNTILYKN